MLETASRDGHRARHAAPLGVIDSSTPTAMTVAASLARTQLLIGILALAGVAEAQTSGGVGARATVLPAIATRTCKTMPEP